VRTGVSLIVSQRTQRIVSFAPQDMAQRALSTSHDARHKISYRKSCHRATLRCLRIDPSAYTTIARRRNPSAQLSTQSGAAAGDSSSGSSSGASEDAHTGSKSLKVF